MMLLSTQAYSEILLGSLHAANLGMNGFQTIPLAGPSSFTATRIVISHCSLSAAVQGIGPVDIEFWSPDHSQRGGAAQVHLFSDVSITIGVRSDDRESGTIGVLTAQTFSTSGNLAMHVVWPQATSLKDGFAAAPVTPCDVYAFGEELP